jgi:hypothetical protein
MAYSLPSRLRSHRPTGGIQRGEVRAAAAKIDQMKTATR